MLLRVKINQRNLSFPLSINYLFIRYYLKILRKIEKDKISTDPEANLEGVGVVHTDCLLVETIEGKI